MNNFYAENYKILLGEIKYYLKRSNMGPKTQIVRYLISPNSSLDIVQLQTKS